MDNNNNSWPPAEFDGLAFHHSPVSMSNMQDSFIPCIPATAADDDVPVVVVETQMPLTVSPAQLHDRSAPSGEYGNQANANSFYYSNAGYVDPHSYVDASAQSQFGSPMTGYSLQSPVPTQPPLTRQSSYSYVQPQSQQQQQHQQQPPFYPTPLTTFPSNVLVDRRHSVAFVNGPYTPADAYHHLAPVPLHRRASAPFDFQRGYYYFSPPITPSYLPAPGSTWVLSQENRMVPPSHGVNWQPESAPALPVIPTPPAVRTLPPPQYSDDEWRRLAENAKRAGSAEGQTTALGLSGVTESPPRQPTVSPAAAPAQLSSPPYTPSSAISPSPVSVVTSELLEPSPSGSSVDLPPSIEPTNVSVDLYAVKPEIPSPPFRPLALPRQRSRTNEPSFASLHKVDLGIDPKEELRKASALMMQGRSQRRRSAAPYPSSQSRRTSGQSSEVKHEEEEEEEDEEEEEEEIPVVRRRVTRSSASTSTAVPVVKPIQRKVTRGGRKPSCHHSDDDQKIYACPEKDCGGRYKRMEHLNRHYKTIHLGLKDYKCKYCGFMCSRSDNLRQHMNTHER